MSELKLVPVKWVTVTVNSPRYGIILFICNQNRFKIENMQYLLQYWRYLSTNLHEHWPHIARCACQIWDWSDKEKLMRRYILQNSEYPCTCWSLVIPPLYPTMCEILSILLETLTNSLIIHKLQKPTHLQYFCSTHFQAETAVCHDWRWYSSSVVR